MPTSAGACPSLPRPRRFRLLWALDQSGALVRVIEAVKGASYRCPACDAPLLVKEGPIPPKYFSHYPAATDGSKGCSLESAQHRTAELLIAKAVLDWKAGRGPRPMIRRLCSPASWCTRRGGQPRTWEQGIPLRVDDVVVERAHVGGLIPDVTLLSNGRAILAIEVLMAHAVDEAKAARMPVQWIEVRAEDVLNDPTHLVPTQDGLEPGECGYCREYPDRIAEKRERERLAVLREQEQARVEAVRVKAMRGRARDELSDSLFLLAHDLGVEIPAYPAYETALWVCFACRQHLLVFKWSGRVSRPPPQPAPPTVQPIVLESGLERWVNVCPRCHAEVDSPQCRPRLDGLSYEDFNWLPGQGLEQEEKYKWARREGNWLTWADRGALTSDAGH